MTDGDWLSGDLRLDGSSRLTGVARQRRLEGTLRIGECDAILWPLRTRDRWNDGREVEFEVFGVPRLMGWVMPQPLPLGIRLNQCDGVAITAG